ncbi:hypothetical protein ACS0TY_008405 [Phlomoides rotata]
MNCSERKWTTSNGHGKSCRDSQNHHQKQNNRPIFHLLIFLPIPRLQLQVLELVLEDLLEEYPDMISVIKLNGLLHSDNNCALKSKQPITKIKLDILLLFFQYVYQAKVSKNLLQKSILRECGLAHKTIVFVLDEFDLFTQGKQRLLYSLLDAMQSITSQAVLVGVSCRLDADQLLEKRVRSRFSHRKLLFLPPSADDFQRLIEHILLLPTDSRLPNDYKAAFNGKVCNILADEEFKRIIDTLCYSDSTVGNLSRFLFSAICRIDLSSGFLSVENFKSALPCILRQPKLEALKGMSILSIFRFYLSPLLCPFL